MADAIQKLLTPRSLPLLGSESRPETLPILEIDELINHSVASLPSDRRELTRALVYLWNDHLDEAHSIAQAIASGDGSYLHAMVHRREPDYSNARYWLHRVGKHPVFQTLATRADTLLSGHELHDRLVKKGEWDPIAFVDCCERAARLQGDVPTLLMQVQAEEFQVLLDHFLT